MVQNYVFGFYVSFIDDFSRNICIYFYNVFGLMSIPPLGKFLYYVSFIDDLSKNRWIYFLDKTFETFDKFKEFKALVENKTEKKIRMMRIILQELI